MKIYILHRFWISYVSWPEWKHVLSLELGKIFMVNYFFLDSVRKYLASLLMTLNNVTSQFLGSRSSLLPVLIILHYKCYVSFVSFHFLYILVSVKHICLMCFNSEIPFIFDGFKLYWKSKKITLQFFFFFLAGWPFHY